MYGPRLEGAAVVLAPPPPGCIGDAIRWLGDTAVTRYMAVRTPPSREQEEQFYRRMAESATDVFWSIMVGDRHIGGCGLHGIDWRNRTAITGTMIGEHDCWGQGYATEAMRLRTRYAFDELGLETLTTQVYLPNEASKRALLRVGYRDAGLLRRHVYLEGAFCDVWMGEILRDEWRAAGTAT